VKYISMNLYRKMIDFALSEVLERNCLIGFVILVDSLEKSQSVRAGQFSSFTKNWTKNWVLEFL
jgi:hypothetical protein